MDHRRAEAADLSDADADADHRRRADQAFRSAIGIITAVYMIAVWARFQDCQQRLWPSLGIELSQMIGFWTQVQATWRACSGAASLGSLSPPNVAGNPTVFCGTCCRRFYTSSAAHLDHLGVHALLARIVARRRRPGDRCGIAVGAFDPGVDRDSAGPAAARLPGFLARTRPRCTSFIAASTATGSRLSARESHATSMRTASLSSPSCRCRRTTK